MKKLFIILLLLPTICLAQYVVPERQLNTDVHDYANLLTVEQKAEIDAKIQLMRKSSIEMAIVILPELNQEIGETALNISRKWGVGKKGLNNGVLYLIVPSQRIASISVGYGLEGILTDVLTSEIQDEAKIFYKEGDYNKGINHIVDKVSYFLSPEYKNQQQLYKVAEAKKMDNFYDGVITFLQFLFLIGVIIFTIWYFRRRIKIKKEIEQQTLQAIKYREQQVLNKKLGLEKQIKEVDYFIKNYIPSTKVLLKNLKQEYNNVTQKIEKLGFKLSSIDVLVAAIDYNLSIDTKQLGYATMIFIKNKIDHSINEINKLIRGGMNEYKSQQMAEVAFCSHIINIEKLYAKAEKEVDNTNIPRETLEKTKIKISYLMNTVFTGMMYINAFRDLTSLMEYYNSIIMYQENQKNAIEKAALLAKQKKQREENEEYKRKKQVENNDNNSFVIPSSSYRSTPSYSSNNDTSYGGGDSGGGGSNSDW